MLRLWQNFEIYDELFEHGKVGKYYIETCNTREKHSNGVCAVTNPHRARVGTATQ